MKKTYLLYLIPNLYLILWLQWFSYGLLSAIVSFALFLYPFAAAIVLAKRAACFTWLKGSGIQFAMNMILTLITNQFNILGGNGGSWRGATGIMYSEQFVLLLTIFALLLQLFFILPIASAAKGKKQ